jgi:hypothetical protein
VPCEELTSTVCLEVERALVNSRPLTDVPSGPDAAEALTPFHFIISSFPSESPYRNDVMYERLEDGSAASTHVLESLGYGVSSSNCSIVRLMVNV